MCSAPKVPVDQRNSCPYSRCSCPVHPFTVCWAASSGLVPFLERIRRSKAVPQSCVLGKPWSSNHVLTPPAAQAVGVAEEVNNKFSQKRSLFQGSDYFSSMMKALTSVTPLLGTHIYGKQTAGSEDFHVLVLALGMTQLGP